MGKIIIENINGEMSRLPARGADLMIFPMHLEDGTGSPSRLIAVLPSRTSASDELTVSMLFTAAFILIKFWFC